MSEIVQLKLSELPSYFASILPKDLDETNSDDYGLNLTGENYTHQLAFAGFKDGELTVNVKFYPVTFENN